MITTFDPGDIASFTARGEFSLYMILQETPVPLGFMANGEAHFYDAYELLGDEAGAMVSVVIDGSNRNNWSLEA